MTNSDSAVYKTRDLALAATLVTLKFPLLSIDVQMEGKRQMPVGYFIFTNSQSLKETEETFIREDIMVGAKALINNMKNLKAQVVNIANAPMN